VIGKIGTDIQDNKCSWLVVQALQRAQAPQLTVLKARARPPARSHALPCMLLRLPAPPAVRDEIKCVSLHVMHLMHVR